MPVRFTERAGDVVGFVDGVGVGEEEVSSAGGLCSDPAGVAFAGESSAAGQVERRSVEEDHSVVFCRCFSGDFASLVGGGVVDDDDLPLLSEGEARFGLDQEGGEAGRQGPLLIAGRDDYR